jgi:uncharacterized protein
MPRSDWYPIEALPPETTPPDHAVPWKWWDILLAVVVGLIVGLLAAVLAFALLPDSVTPESARGLFVYAGLVYASQLYFAWLLVLKRRGVTFRDIGLKKPTLKALLLVIPILLGTFFVEGVVSQIVNEFIGPTPTAEDQLFSNGPAQTGLVLPWILIVVGVFAPFVEEIIFRGIIYKYLRSKMRVGVAAVLSGLIFACIHFTPLLIPSLTVLGIALAFVYERFGSLYVPMALHSLNNVVVVAIVFSTN